MRAPHDRRRLVVSHFLALLAAGHARKVAFLAIRRRHGVSRRTVYRWVALSIPIPQEQKKAEAEQ